MNLPPWTQTHPDIVFRDGGVIRIGHPNDNPEMVELRALDANGKVTHRSVMDGAAVFYFAQVIRELIDNAGNAE